MTRAAPGDELTTWALRTPHLRDVARQQFAAGRGTAAAIVAPPPPAPAP